MVNKLLLLILVFTLAVTSSCQQHRIPGSISQVEAADNRIAFSRLTGDYWQVWTMNPNGTGARQITYSPSDKKYPAWIRDGKGILFRTNDSQLFAIDIENGSEGRIAAPLGLIGSMAVSPDGNQLVVAKLRSRLRDAANLWLTSLDGTDGKMLSRSEALQYDPAWSPDGKQIVYVGSKGYRTDEIYIIDSNGENQRRLTNNKTLESVPVFSPDGRIIAYSSDETGDYEIWLRDIQRGSAKRLTSSEGLDTRPCWSPDGNRIVFVSNRGGSLQLWIMNSDGSNQRQLTFGSPSMDPVWRTGINE